MCGIAGIIGAQANKNLLSAMLVKQQHRGPDYTGIWAAENIVLGHNRLSILDLSEAGHQPFYSANGRFVLVFNGEIYNYLEIKKELESQFEFKTASDTEVLLHAYMAWGEDCLEKCNGMFSFAIWDIQNQSLFAARDRFGVKPFYYSFLEDSFVFASEIPTLWEAGIKKQTNDEVWASFFAFGSYGMPDQTFWYGVHQLPGGHFLRLQQGEMHITKWYHFEKRIKALQKETQKDEDAYILALLNDAIQLRFRADVPVGFNLSGGLDSSTLLALVNHAFPKDNGIEAFTFYTGDERYDELKWVEMMLEDKVYPLNKCLLTADNVIESAEVMAHYQAEPFGGVPTLAYAEVFKAARKKGVLVLLDGQGSDEAWAGYDYYLGASTEVVQGVKTSPFRTNVLTPEFLALAKKPEYPSPFNDDLLDKQYRDLFYTKIPRALRFNDRVSMLHSTELREPFLDYRLVEYVFSRSQDFKIKDGVQKWFLRKIAGNYLGNNITLAPKRPLQTPQREWLGNELKTWTTAQIGKLESSPWFDAKSLKNETELYMDGEQDNSFYLWQWINAGMIL
jgi:asparagine synthase (glutamine-hydrolysing)